MTIRTSALYPPIPLGADLWAAWDDATYAPGHPVGRGATEAEAVADLMEQLGEAA